MEFVLLSLLLVAGLATSADGGSGADGGGDDGGGGDDSLQGAGNDQIAGGAGNDRLILNGGVRYDDHDRYGGQTLFAAGGVWRLPTGTLLRASYGEGFKAPSLFQLFSEYGNVGLDPDVDPVPSENRLHVQVEHFLAGVERRIQAVARTPAGDQFAQACRGGHRHGGCG